MTSRRWMWTVVISVVVVTVGLGDFVSAQTLDAKDRAEFNRLVQQRNRLSRQLHGLDRQASDLMKQGREPVVVHAEQVSVQDQLDLMELRLAILATRNGVAVPPLPEEAESVEGGANAPTDRKIARAFVRGRERAIEQLRQDGYRFLASLDFTAFLNQ